MSKDVNRRTYSSPLRQEHAARTRARILDAAAEAFVANGYAATTVRDIAERAAVAPDTVYATFGAKVRVLTALIDQRLAPSGAPNVMDRPEALRVRDETDQRLQCRWFARDMAAVSTRVRPMYEMLQAAASVEPDLVRVRDEMDGYRYRNMRRVVEWIAARGPLRVEPDRAADIVYAVTSPEVGRLLRERRGWSEDEHAAWIEDCLVGSLL